MGIDLLNLRELEVPLGRALIDDEQLGKAFHGCFHVWVQFIGSLPKGTSFKVTSKDTRVMCSTETADSSKYGHFPKPKYLIVDDDWTETYGPEFYQEVSAFSPRDMEPRLVAAIDTLDVDDSEVVYLIMIKGEGVTSAFVIWMFGKSDTVHRDYKELEYVVLMRASRLVFAKLKHDDSEDSEPEEV